MSITLLVVLILMFIAAIPVWPYSKGWGYGPSSGLGSLTMILISLLLTGAL